MNNTFLVKSLISPLFSICLIFIFGYTTSNAAAWYSMSSGNWGDGGTANLWNTQPDGSGTFASGSTMLPIGDDLVVQTGHNIQLTGFAAGDYEFNNLKILVNGSIYTTATPQTSVVIANGTVISVNGSLNIGHTTFRLGTGVTSILGSGTITAGNLQINPLTPCTLELNATILGDFHPAYLNGSQFLRSFEITNGHSLTVRGNVYVDPDVASNPNTNNTEVRGELFVNGTLMVEGNIDLRSNDVTGMVYMILTGANGKIALNQPTSQITGAAASFPGNAETYLDIKGELEFAGADMIVDPSSRSVVIMRTNSKLILSGSGNQMLDDAIQNGTYYDVEILNGTGMVSLEGHVQIDNRLVQRDH